ncbi:MAG: DUF1501 domain-containing protein, partial [Sphingobacteriales bacterium]
MKSPFAFRQYGQSGTWASEIFPHTVQHVDDMAFIHSCHTETNNHSPALFQINTGMSRHRPRPCWWWHASWPRACWSRCW